MKPLTIAAVAVPLALPLAGCVQTTGILPLGPDTYNISMSGGAEYYPAAQKVWGDAQAKCAAEGKEILALSYYGSVRSANLTFRCLYKTDRDYRRPNYTPAGGAVPVFVY